MSAPPLGWSHAYLPHQKEIYVPCGMKFLQEFQDLKTKNIHSSRIRIITSWTSNFLPSLAPRARTQARCSTKFLITTILKRVNFWHMESVNMDLDKSYKIIIVSLFLLIVWHVLTVQKWVHSM